MKLQVVTIMFFIALHIVQMRFFNEYNENIGLTPQNYMGGTTVEKLSLLGAKKLDTAKTLAEEMIEDNGLDPSTSVWLKKLKPVEVAYLNSYRQLPSEWTETHGRFFFVIMAGWLIGIEIWFFYLFYIEIVIQLITTRQTIEKNFWFKFITCGSMKGEKLKKFRTDYFTQEEL
jgi:hypothetical protein